MLEADPRFSDRLSLDTKEKLFRDHCKGLQLDIETAFKVIKLSSFHFN